VSLDLSRIRVVLFDIDGTLRDTDDELVDRLARRTTRLLGEDRAARWVRQIVMRAESPVQHVLARLDAFSMDGPVHRLIEHLEHSDGQTRLTPGAREIVAEWSTRFRLGVVSAGPESTVRRFLVEHGLDRSMEVVVSGLTCSRTKPHPMPIVHAARVLAHNATDVLMVGDTTVDIVAGRKAGAQTVGVLTGFGDRAELERAGATAIVDDLPQLRALVGSVAVPPQP
jgi:HAD superfamily hydrolase (TIGR01549 family)